jgi:H+/Cl- antiporter ClcA
MLGAGVACGLGVSLSSIIGGVLFSIEVTSTYYPIRNYWYAFTAALIGTVSFKVLSNLFFGNGKFFISFHFDSIHLLLAFELSIHCCEFLKLCWLPSLI